MTYIQMQSSYTKEAVNFGHEMEKKNIISSYFIKHIFEKLTTCTCIMISMDQENTKSFWKPKNG